jgi:hypothetical protein
MKKTIILTIGSIFALLAGSQPARAQVQDELQAFQQYAGDRSILYRGKQGTRYTFLANGHPYWSQPAYERGDILFEGNLYRNVPINIDAVAQRALVQMENSPFAVALTPEHTPSFTMGGRQFVGIGPDGALPEGFYEVFGDGPEHVYKHVIKQVNSNTQNVNGDIIGYYDPEYRSDVTRHFAIHKYYYFRDADGNFSRFKGRAALLRKFPDRKKIRQGVSAIRGNQSDFSFDDFCKAVLYTAAQ